MHVDGRIKVQFDYGTVVAMELCHIVYDRIYAGDNGANGPDSPFHIFFMLSCTRSV